MTSQTKPTTREERAAQVERMNASAKLEGFEPDEEDKRIQAEYVAGTKTIADLLEHAREFAQRHAKQS